MGLFDSIMGRSKPPKPNLDQLFGIPSAAITLSASLGFEATGSGAVAFRVPEGRAFAEVQAEIEALQVRLQTLKSRLLLIYNLAAILVTLMFLWVIYSQYIVIRHHIRRFRTPAAAAPAAAPAAPAEAEAVAPTEAEAVAPAEIPAAAPLPTELTADPEQEKTG